MREASCGYFSYSGSNETLVPRISNNGDKHKGAKKPGYENHLSQGEQVTAGNKSSIRQLSYSMSECAVTYPFEDIPMVVVPGVWYIHTKDSSN